jgi:class 3 adenylate cyclase
MSEEDQTLPLPKEGVLSILSALTNYPDADVFSALANYFFHDDFDIAREAIRSSGFRTNGEAVDHLLHIIQSDRLERKLEALRALSAIEAPHAAEKLHTCHAAFKEPILRREILRTLNAIHPDFDRTLELNRGILTNERPDDDLAVVAVTGLIAAEDFSFLAHYLAHTTAKVQKRAFTMMIPAQNEKVSVFLKKLGSNRDVIAPEARGEYITAYLLNTQNPNIQFVLDMLSDCSLDQCGCFLDSLSQNIDRSFSHRVVLKVLLMLPYTGGEIEERIGEIIDRLLYIFKEISPGSTGELITVTSAHMETVFKKVKENFVSLKDMKSREELLPLFLAHLLQKYCPHSELEDVLSYFKDPSKVDPKQVIQRLTACIERGSSADIKGYRACLPLFQEKNHQKRLFISMILRKIDPQMVTLLMRLRRLLRAAGFLKMTGQKKRIWEIYSFAIEEKVQYLEETAIVSLSQIGSRNILTECEGVLLQPQRKRAMLKSYIWGARYLPSEIITDRVVHVLYHADLTPDERDTVIDTLLLLDFSHGQDLSLRVLNALRETYIEREQKVRIAEVVAVHGSRALIDDLVTLTGHGDWFVRALAIRIIRHIERGTPGNQHHVIVERLYALLEDEAREVRVEALVTLLALGDDYAREILSDWIDGDDNTLVAVLISRVHEVITESILPAVLRPIRSAHLEIQRAMRGLLELLSRDVLSDQVREILLREMEGLPTLTSKRKKGRTAPSPSGDIFLHAKREFKLRRESSQFLAVFFIDMIGYTRRTAKSDMTNLMKMVETFEGILRPSIAEFNGQVVKQLGDGMLAVFKHPANAVISALEVIGKINEYNIFAVDSERFKVRVGIHLGSVMWKNGDIFGDVVNVAARMEASAGPNEVLITETMYEKVKEYVTCDERGEVTVKGFDEPIKVYVPRGVVRDVRALLEIKSSNVASLLSQGKKGRYDGLKEAFFNPRFEIPAGSDENGVSTIFKNLFHDLASMVSQITGDSHEEFLFKRFLQEKWDETLPRLRGKGGKT